MQGFTNLCLSQAWYPILKSACFCFKKGQTWGQFFSQVSLVGLFNKGQIIKSACMYVVQVVGIIIFCYISTTIGCIFSIKTCIITSKQISTPFLSIFSSPLFLPLGFLYKEDGDQELLVVEKRTKMSWAFNF